MTPAASIPLAYGVTAQDVLTMLRDPGADVIAAANRAIKAIDRLTERNNRIAARLGCDPSRVETEVARIARLLTPCADCAALSTAAICPDCLERRRQ